MIAPYGQILSRMVAAVAFWATFNLDGGERAIARATTATAAEATTTTMSNKSAS